jgi:hypothetical protein
MRALAMCNSAQVRSVTLGRLLRKRGLETLCCGVDKDFSDGTIQMCCEWAEVIFIQADSKAKFVKRFGELGPPGSWLGSAYPKMDLRFDVGPDDWKVPQAKGLLKKMRKLVMIAFEDPAFLTKVGLGK